METYTIKNLPELVSSHLEPGTEIIDSTVSKLPQGGYGSIMLKVDLKLKNKNGSEETRHLVAKILPAAEEVRKMFNVQVTFKNEAAFYNTVIPTLENFQKENGVTGGLNMFAKFYGARINLLQDSEVVDDDAVLLLENLIESGFQNLKRGESFDLDTARVIIGDLAKFQATVIGLKLKHPKVFDDKIKTACHTFKFDQDGFKMIAGPFKAIITENPQCVPFADCFSSFGQKKPSSPREPYATMIHCDLWINNTMQKFENGKILKNIIVDFQGIDYRSCASDLFFFLWTSVQTSVLENNIDSLIEHYHNNLVETLQELNCDTTQFSLDKFYDELRLEAEYEFGHAFLFSFMARNPGFAVTHDKHDTNKDKFADPEHFRKTTPLFLKEHLWFMILECNKRGWLPL